MRILWITNIPSPYRVDFFNELGKSCDLTVVFEKKASDERDSTWKNYRFDNFDGIILAGKSVRTDAAICPDIIKVIQSEKYDQIVLTNIASPTGILAGLYMRLRRIPYWIEGDGALVKQTTRIQSRIKGIAKKVLMKGAKGYFSTGKSHDEYYLLYGASRDKLYRYSFSSISRATYECAMLLTDEESADNEISFQGLTDIEKRQIIRGLAKKRLGISNEKKVALFVGQMIHRKGIDVLLECAEKMCAERKDVLFMLVGGTCPDELREKAKRIPESCISFVPFMSPDKLQYYYRAADVFCLPTREDIWGLVINEAMTYSLPIVTTDRCGAGIELIESGENGYLVPVDDVLNTKISIENALINKEKMGLRSRAIIRPYTIEDMAKQHIDVFRGILDDARA